MVSEWILSIFILYNISYFHQCHFPFAIRTDFSSRLYRSCFNQNPPLILANLRATTQNCNVFTFQSSLFPLHRQRILFTTFILEVTLSPWLLSLVGPFSLCYLVPDSENCQCHLIWELRLPPINPCLSQSVPVSPLENTSSSCIQFLGGIGLEQCCPETQDLDMVCFHAASTKPSLKWATFSNFVDDLFLRKKKKIQVTED